MSSIYNRQKRYFKEAYKTGNHGWPAKGATKEVVSYLKKITMAKGGRALDLGCGEGRHSILMAKMGYEVYAIDYAPLAIRKARQFARENGVSKKIHFQVKDGMALAFPSNFFDVIVDYGFFHHVVKADNPIYKRNITRLLKAGGHLILCVFSTKFKHYPGEKRTRNFLVHRNHYDRFFTKSDILQLSENWLQVVQIVEEHKGLNGFYHALLKKP